MTRRWSYILVTTLCRLLALATSVGLVPALAQGTGAERPGEVVLNSGAL